MLNDWVEQGIKPWLNEGFLEYWRESRSPYRGAFGEIVVMQECEAVKNYIGAIIDELKDNNRN